MKKNEENLLNEDLENQEVSNDVEEKKADDISLFFLLLSSIILNGYET